MNKNSQSSIFRSEKMGYYQLVVPREAAWLTLNELGKQNHPFLSLFFWEGLQLEIKIVEL